MFFPSFMGLVGDVVMHCRSRVPELPEAPENLVGTPGPEEVTFTWDDVEGADRYLLSYGTVEGGPYDIEDIPATSPWLLNNQAIGVPLYAVVRAGNDAGLGPFSDEATATPTE